MKKTVLITGASSGIGKETAKLFQSMGWNVVATMRTPEKEQELTKFSNIICIKLDVTKPEAIAAALQATIDKFRGIDVLVNNAGYGIMGPFELTSHEKIINQFNTNLFGLMEVIRAALPWFRKQGGGVIINVASMGGQVGFPLWSVYNSTKFAVEGFSEAVSYELAAQNIIVKVIEPGVIKTDFHGRSADRIPGGENSSYQSFIKRALPKLDEFGKKGILPDKVAKVIYKAATDDKQQLRYPVGPDAWQLAVLKKILPTRLFYAIFKRVLISSK